MPRLAIQICALNEEATLPATLNALPRKVAGFDSVRIIVVDDGSADRTAEVAAQHGADVVVRHAGRQGLARAFMSAVEASIAEGADVVVHTDADNQYDARDIPALLAPITAGRADIVVGARPIETIRHFSFTKRLLQRLGTRVVRSLSGTDITDAPSGFRAFTRDAALRLNVFGSFSYTLETLIQAGRSNLCVVSVPVRVNPPTRPSRLARSSLHYTLRSAGAIIAAYIAYRPVAVFGVLAAAFALPSVVLAARYLAFMLQGAGKGHVQSVIVASGLGGCAVFMLAIGAIAHLLAVNRRLLEEIRYLERASRASTAAQPPQSAPITVRPRAALPATARATT